MPERKIKSSSNLSNHISGMKVFMDNENAANGMRAFSALVKNENQLEFIYTSDEDRALNVIRSSYYGSTSYGDFTEITFITEGRAIKVIYSPTVKVVNKWHLAPP